jgi:thiol-disulfide isomerase/thioredoxin
LPNQFFIRVAAEDRCGIFPQMRSGSVTTTTIILVLFGLALHWVGTARADSPVVLKLAPDFVLESSAGRNLRLSELRGDVVIVNFWSSGCGRCREQLDQLATISEVNRPNHMSILSVNVDGDSSRAMRIIADQNLGFPVLFDTDKIVSRLYDPRRLPMTVMVDPHGIVRYIQEGYHRGDEVLYAQKLAELLAE